MPISSLSFTNVGPFEEVEFSFDSQVNVFTGPNNSGKSSVLWVIGDVAVYPFNFPRKLLRDGKTAKFELAIKDEHIREFGGQLPIVGVSSEKENGFWTPKRWSRYVELLGKVGYTKFIPALRRSTEFRSRGPTVMQGQDYNTEIRQTGKNQPVRSTEQMAFNWTKAMDLRSIVKEPELRRRLALTSEDASLISDEAVIQMIIDLDYRSYLKRRPGLRNIISKVGEIASEIAEDFPIVFDGIDEDEDGFFPQFATMDGPMPLNTMSQGTQSIVQWLAHLLIGYGEYYDFPDNLADLPGILIIDEIDAHLHPSWQQRVIPTLTRHFPNLQLFCSTHSPLMLTGLREGQIQLMRRDKNGKVTVSRNDMDVIAWSADEVFRSILGVHDPTDLETAGHLERLQALRGKETLSTKEDRELESLRRTVREDLLRGPMASQIEQFDRQLKGSFSEDSPCEEPLPYVDEG